MYGVIKNEYKATPPLKDGRNWKLVLGFGELQTTILLWWWAFPSCKCSAHKPKFATLTYKKNTRSSQINNFFLLIYSFKNILQHTTCKTSCLAMCIIWKITQIAIWTRLMEIAVLYEFHAIDRMFVQATKSHFFHLSEWCCVSVCAVLKCAC